MPTVIMDSDFPPAPTTTRYYRRSPSPVGARHIHTHSIGSPILHHDDMYLGRPFGNARLSPQLSDRDVGFVDRGFEDRMRRYVEQDYVISPASSGEIRYTTRAGPRY